MLGLGDHAVMMGPIMVHEALEVSMNDQGLVKHSMLLLRIYWIYLNIFE